MKKKKHTKKPQTPKNKTEGGKNKQKTPTLQYLDDVTMRIQKALQDKHDIPVTGLSNRWDCSVVHSDLRRI